MDWVDERIPHNVVAKRFNKPTYCEFCNDLIWGIVGKQGMKCLACKANFHNECVEKLDEFCGLGINTEGLEHDFEEHYFGKFTFCNVCRDFVQGITGKQALKCTRCGFVSHRKCQAECTTSCPVLSFDEKTITRKHHHFWIEGNIRGKCFNCKKDCNLNTHLGGVRCFWCNTKLCSHKCRLEIGEICDHGKFANLIIPPTGIITNGSDDIREWTFRTSTFEGKKPLFVFINKRSGGGLGGSFMRAFSYWLNPLQIIDLGNGGPDPALEALHEIGLNKFTYIACGGDGTVAWLLSALDKLDLGDNYPPVAVLPLGTGNDLSRSLGWGHGANKPTEVKKKYLPHICTSREISLDRWEIMFNNKRVICNNYFSIGVDAKIALDFHKKREEHPEKFTSRGMNKLWYAKFGTDAIFSGITKLEERIMIELDGDEIVLPKMEALVVINLPSCYGGAYLWSTSSKYDPVCINDGLFEVVCLTDAAHVGQVQAGLATPIIIGKGSQLRIRFDETIYTQVDGEPWEQEEGVIEMNYFNQVNMLCYPSHAHETLLSSVGSRILPDEESFSEDDTDDDY